MSKIIEVIESNIKRIKFVDITPKENIVIIEGDNKAGKTSFFDGISYAFGGQKLIPKEPLRKGETDGFVRVILDDFEVSRNWTSRENSYLKIKIADGKKPEKSLQAFLDERIGTVALEVMDFVNMDNEHRIKLFKNLTGINLDDLREKYDAIYQQRKDDNRDFDKLKKEAENYVNLPEIEKGLDFKSLQKERKDKSKTNDVIEEKKIEINQTVIKQEQVTKDSIRIRKDIDALQTEIKRKEREVNELTSQVVKHNINIGKMKEEIENLTYYDLSEIDKKIKKAMDNSELEFKYARKKELDKDIAVQIRIIENHNKKLESVKTERERRLREAVMPIKGITFDGKELKYNDIDIDECSKAEQIEISIALGIKEKPDVKDLFVRDGSAIGKKAMETIENLAEKYGFRIWIERVAEGKGNEIYIEDGMVK